MEDESNKKLKNPLFWMIETNFLSEQTTEFALYFIINTPLHYQHWLRLKVKVQVTLLQQIATGTCFFN